MCCIHVHVWVLAGPSSNQKSHGHEKHWTQMSSGCLTLGFFPGPWASVASSGDGKTTLGAGVFSRLGSCTLLISMARRQFFLGVYLIKYTGELAVASVYLEPGCCSSFQCFCVKAPFLLKFGSMTLDLGHVVGFVFEDITVPGLTRFPCSCSLVLSSAIFVYVEPCSSWSFCPAQLYSAQCSGCSDVP